MKTKNDGMPIKTSDEIRTMSNSRSSWSLTKSLSGGSRPRDDARILRNNSFLKRQTTQEKKYCIT
jgi:hypothetical protein